MPEDGIGFRFFSRDQRAFIANDAAVRVASVHLQNEVAFDAAFEHLGRAVEAVSTAALRHSAVDPGPDEVDIPPFVEGADLFLF